MRHRLKETVTLWLSLDRTCDMYALVNLAALFGTQLACNLTAGSWIPFVNAYADARLNY